MGVIVILLSEGYRYRYLQSRPQQTVGTGYVCMDHGGGGGDPQWVRASLCAAGPDREYPDETHRRNIRRLIVN